MSINSMQTSSCDIPKANETSLAIGLSCPDCETLRFYKFDRTINLVLNRVISGLSVSARCEVCSRRFVCALQWIDPISGFSYRKPPTTDNVNIIEDENGLKYPHEKIDIA